LGWRRRVGEKFARGCAEGWINGARRKWLCREEVVKGGEKA
jgi:hypothetical protein